MYKILLLIFLTLNCNHSSKIEKANEHIINLEKNLSKEKLNKVFRSYLNLLANEYTNVLFENFLISKEIKEAVKKNKNFKNVPNVLRIFIENGVNLEIYDINSQKFTILHWAVILNDKNLLRKILLNNKTMKKDLRNLTPKDLAIKLNNRELILFFEN